MLHLIRVTKKLMLQEWRAAAWNTVHDRSGVGRYPRPNVATKYCAVHHNNVTFPRHQPAAVDASYSSCPELSTRCRPGRTRGARCGQPVPSHWFQVAVSNSRARPAQQRHAAVRAAPGQSVRTRLGGTSSLRRPPTRIPRTPCTAQHSPVLSALVLLLAKSTLLYTFTPNVTPPSIERVPHLI